MSAYGREGNRAWSKYANPRGQKRLDYGEDVYLITRVDTKGTHPVIHVTRSGKRTFHVVVNHLSSIRPADSSRLTLLNVDEHTDAMVCRCVHAVVRQYLPVLAARQKPRRNFKLKREQKGDIETLFK